MFSKTKAQFDPSIPLPNDIRFLVFWIIKFTGFPWQSGNYLQRGKGNKN